jgi:2-keto-4-pentenoate hydratase/2-oxohepta-3-ene-1,7-dioic acid hydratase in catechol pathway
MEAGMKLATYLHEGAAQVGVVLADRVLGLADAGFHSMMTLIEAGPAGLERVRRLVAEQGEEPAGSVPLGQVTLLAPVPVPAQIRDFSVFPKHIRQSSAGMMRLAALAKGDNAAAEAVQVPEEVPSVYRRQPVYYFSNRFSVVGPEANIVWPRYSKVMDFELEFGVFIGPGGKNIARGDAARHIFGYTIYNDFSARDAQLKEMQSRLGPTKGKSFDSGNAMGPWIVTPDEMPDMRRVKMSVRVNGETWASGSSADMLHDFADMIEWVSRDETLYPGEFFGSGTMGNGCGLEQGRFLADGDMVEAEVDGIGVLRNRVVVQESTA